MACPYRPGTTNSECRIDKLRRQQPILRVATARLLKAANELLEAPSPSSHDLQAAIDLLASKDAALYEIEGRIVELVDRDKLDQDYFNALTCRGEICRTLMWLRDALKVAKSPGMTATTNGTSGTPISPRPLTFVFNGIRPATHRSDPSEVRSLTSTSKVTLPTFQVPTFKLEPREPQSLGSNFERTTCEHRDLSEMELTDTRSSTSITPRKRIESANHIVHMTTYGTSTRDSVRPAGPSEHNGSRMVMQGPVSFNATRDARKRFFPAPDKEKTMETNLSTNVSEFSEKQIVAAAQASTCKTEDEAERKDLLVGACYEGASNNPTEGGGAYAEAPPAAHNDCSEAAVETDNENPGDLKDEKDKAEPPPCEIECIFFSDKVKSKRLLEVRKSRRTLTSEGLLHVVPRHESEVFSEVAKAEKPWRVTSAPCKEAAGPGGEPSEPYIELTRSRKTMSSGEEKQTERKHKAGMKTPLDSRARNVRTLP